MKNRLYSLIVLISSLFFFIGCSNIEELKIGTVRNLEFKGMNNNVLSLSIMIPIENPNAFRIKLKDADLTISTGQTVLGKIIQTETLIIPGKSSKEYSIPIKVEITGLNNNLLSLYSLINSKPDFKLTGSVKVRSGLYRKKFKIKDYQVAY